MSELSELRPYRRIGHHGSKLMVPGDVLASFDAAVELGVDMIEFDVLPHRGRLLLAHDPGANLAAAPTLEEGLRHLAGLPVELDVDLKWHGYEEAVVDALREHGLLDRALVSSMFMRSLVRVRELEPALRVGWSIPRARRDYTRSVLLKLPAAGAVAYLRRRAPDAVARHLREGRIDAVMAHYLLATPRLVRTVLDHGGEIYVWTVDDPARIQALERLGVTGIISNDPSLFGAR